MCAWADTRYYWKLSRSIFRYNHKNTVGSKERLSGVHTVNEGESYAIDYPVQTPIVF